MVRKGFIIIMIIGLLAAGYIVSQDYTMQENNKNLVLVLDFEAIKDWSDQTGNPVEDMLEIAKDSQISHIGLAELSLRRKGQTLESFADQEVDISAYLGSEFAEMKQKNINFTKIIDKEDINVDHFYLVSTNLERVNQISIAAKEKYGRERVKFYNDENTYILEIINSPSENVNGIGFDPREVDIIENAGMRIIPRPLNVVFDNEQLKNYQCYIKELFNSSLVIFAGDDGVLGSRLGTGDNLINTSSTMLYPKNSEGMIYGFVEMTAIKGDKELARNVNYDLARVHSISKPEWDKRYNTFDADEMTVKEIVERYTLAANDRSINVFYLRPFTKDIKFNENYFISLTNNLIDQDYNLGAITTIPTRADVPIIITFTLFAGLGGALGLLFLTVFKKQRKLALVFFALGILGGLFLLVSGRQHIISKFGAFFTALSFPVVGIIWGYFEKRRSNNKLVNSLHSFIRAVIVSVMGGLYVHAFLASASYMTAIDVFPMVKLALLAPPLIIAILYVLKEDVLKSIIKFMKTNLQVFHIFIAGIAFIMLVFIAMRSGNNPIIPVTNLEMKIRLFLQSNLIARPRFKEFAIGYPLLILAGVFAQKEFSKLFVIIGSIGLSSLVNTFAHLHKPVKMAFFTSINGLILGTIIGVICAILIVQVKKVWWDA